MYQELARVAELSALSYWPLPERFSGQSAPVLQQVLANLTMVGWKPLDNGLTLLGENRERPLQIRLDWPDCLDRPEFRGQVAAESAALKLLAAAHVPLQRTLRLTSASGEIVPGDTLVWRAGSVGEPGEGGLLALLVQGEHGNLVRLPETGTGLLNQAKNALKNADLQPRFYLRTGFYLDGLGYLAPGRPERSQTEMARAITAYATLVYGLAGYGVMAFQFDLDF